MPLKKTSAAAKSKREIMPLLISVLIYEIYKRLRFFADCAAKKWPFGAAEAGCSKISPGCKHCYAERFAERFRGVPGHPFEQGFDLRLVPEKLGEPLRWGTPQNDLRQLNERSLSRKSSAAYISKVASVMRFAGWHTYQVLTKRSSRLRELLNGPLRNEAMESHIWGAVEDRKHGVPRIADLQAAPAKVRFLSIEPLLEDLGTLRLDGIAWVIVGGESGPGARSMREEWVP